MKPYFLFLRNSRTTDSLRRIGRRVSRPLSRCAYAACALLTATALFAADAARTPGAFTVQEATVADIHRAFKSGRLTARQLVQQYLDRIEALDRNGPKINSIITVAPDALDEADRLDAQFRKTGLTGPLHGIPILVKDEIDTKGMPTTLGSVVFKDYYPTLDATVVAKMKKAGAIILGKTTLSEFASGDTYGSIFGVTRNPYDLKRTVGGSSGGSGACLAANFSTLALGEETYASIRRPASWNGVVSIRPTSGLVSRAGMWDGFPGEAAMMGPMARTVEDVARMMDVMTGYDPEDPQTALSAGHMPESYTKLLDKAALKGARIGILRESIGVSSEPESDDFKKVSAVFEKNIAELKAAGAIVIDDIKIPGIKELQTKRAGNAAASEAALRVWLARNPTSDFKTRDDIRKSPDLDKIFPPTKAAQWKQGARKEDPAKYLEYLAAREQLMINLLQVMADNKLDAIVHKSVEHQPTLIETGTKPPYPTNKGVPIVNTFLVYVPSITVPSGFTTDDLPTGITFLGRPYSDASMIRLAYSYEQATHHRKAPKTTP